jgi:ABC-type uncharacterized transport system ATPase subunit
MAGEDESPQPDKAVGAGNALIPSPPVLSIRHLTKSFPGVVANDDISLDFHAGEIHVLLGENGAGKSTLIGIVAGMIPADAGEILVDGKPAHIASPRHSLDLGIGTVFQHVLLVPSLTVIENLMLGGPWWRGLRRAPALARFAELSALLGVNIDPDAPLGGLSLGEQQQIEIMRALWRDERVLILDEPTSMLTPEGVRDLGAVMRRLRAQGVAVILVTHKLAEAYELGDRISVLRHGRLVGAIAPNERRDMSEAEVTERVVAMMFGGNNAPGAAERELLIGRGHGRTHIVDRAARPCLEVTGISTAAVRGACPVHEVSFALWPGEVLGIAGIDGNGQKHLAEALAGQRECIAGSIRVSGRDVTNGDVPMRRRAGIRYVTDDRLGEGAVAGMSVAVNLLLKEIGVRPFWRGGVADWALIREHARARIRHYGIRTPTEMTSLGKLSGGNIQKVLLARELEREMDPAAATGADIVIFAKPTHGLDLHNARLAHDSIRRSAQAGTGVIVLSTDLEELLALSDRIAVLYPGRLAGIVDNGPQAGPAIGRLMAGAQAA